MTDNDVINDINFRNKCSAYGLDWENFYIHDDMIILRTPKSNIRVILDKHYNTIDIYDSNDEKKEKVVYNIRVNCIKYLYETAHNDLPYPFKNLSLKQMVELANRVIIRETNHGHSSYMIVNGELVADDTDSVYINLLSYIKFLGKQIEQYFMNLYQMKMMGFKYISVYKYIDSLMYNIDECVSVNFKRGNKPYPADIIEYLGKSKKDIELYNHELYRIIDLLFQEKELKKIDVQLTGGSEYFKTYIVTKKDTIDLSKISMELLKILEVPDKEVESRYQESNRTFEIKEINLQSWLSESNNKDKTQALTKSKKKY